MSGGLEGYVDVVGEQIIATIYEKARRLYGKRTCDINSTFLGGGVAEILSRLVPLINETGADAEWRTLHGNPAFFDVTKKFHNALQGSPINLSPLKKSLYTDVNREFAGYTHLNHDLVTVHDPQPLPLINYYRKQQPWIWRCHIDISEPHEALWRYLKRFMLKYDVVIVSSEEYLKTDLPVRQKVIRPAIDPLSLKNRDLSERDVHKYARKAGVPLDKPLLTQVSRMDSWKDPEGVLKVYEHVRENVNCRLLYCYNLATDDPQGMEIYARVRQKAKRWIDKGDVLFVLGNNDILVNAVQRISAVILQKSTREGFGLTVTEALWKAKPVVAGNVGGIPMQIEDGETGFLVDPTAYKACAERVIELLKHPKLASEMGKRAKERVRESFLITRLVADHLDLAAEFLA